jgi:hypothetical protein
LGWAGWKREGEREGWAGPKTKREREIK